MNWMETEIGVKGSLNGFCLVESCNNGATGLRVWRSSLCPLNEGYTHGQGACMCRPPFVLYTFPKAKDEQRRKTWAKLINKKHWSQLNTTDRVCSEHFVEGKPTLAHPNPTLFLGTACNSNLQRKHTGTSAARSSRRPKRKHSVASAARRAAAIAWEAAGYSGDELSDQDELDSKHHVSTCRPTEIGVKTEQQMPAVHIDAQTAAMYADTQPSRRVFTLQSLSSSSAAVSSNSIAGISLQSLVPNRVVGNRDIFASSNNNSSNNIAAIATASNRSQNPNHCITTPTSPLASDPLRSPLPPPPGKQFIVNAADLLKNLASVVTESDVTHTCKQCHSEFTTRTLLEQHHQQAKLCYVCDERLCTKNHLEAHLGQHANATSHLRVCVMCYKVFTQPSLLKDHLMSHHTATKQYRCGWCKRLFLDERSVKLHVSADHMEHLYECSVCLAKFSSMDETKLHLQRKHPKHTAEAKHQASANHNRYTVLGTEEEIVQTKEKFRVITTASNPSHEGDAKKADADVQISDNPNTSHKTVSVYPYTEHTDRNGTMSHASGSASQPQHAEGELHAFTDQGVNYAGIETMDFVEYGTVTTDDEAAAAINTDGLMMTTMVVDGADLQNVPDIMLASEQTTHADRNSLQTDTQTAAQTITRIQTPHGSKQTHSDAQGDEQQHIQTTHSILPMACDTSSAADSETDGWCHYCAQHGINRRTDMKCLTCDLYFCQTKQLNCMLSSHLVTTTSQTDR